jgi:glycosyltransferase involved in cell wall biosynthesis
MTEVTRPLVSVCVVTYNHAPYIEKAISSALAQRGNFDLEICIGEDDSTDGTRALCEQLAQQHPETIRLFKRSRNQVIHQDGKPTGIFNFLETLKSCRGKYIALLEGDDYWTFEGKLNAQIQYLEGNATCSGCFHSCLVVNDEGNEISPSQSEASAAAQSSRIELPALLSSGSLAPTASLVLRRTAVENLPYWYTRNPSDWKIEIMLAMQGELVQISNEKWSAYRVHQSGLWSGESVLRQIAFKERQVSDLRTVPALAAYTRSLNEYMANAYQLGYLKLQSTNRLQAIRLLVKFTSTANLSSWIKAKHFVKTGLSLALNRKASHG